MVRCSLLAENIFRFFEGRTHPSIHLSKSPATAGLIKKSSCSWTFLLVYKGYKFSKSIFSQSFSGNHFSPRFLVPFSLLAENIFSVFRSPHLPLDTPFWTRGFPLVMRSRKAGFPFATRARKREPCLQRYVSRMTRTENFLSQFFFKVFLETTFLHVLWYAVHY